MYSKADLNAYSDKKAEFKKHKELLIKRITDVLRCIEVATEEWSKSLTDTDDAAKSYIADMIAGVDIKDDNEDTGPINVRLGNEGQAVIGWQVYAQYVEENWYCEYSVPVRLLHAADSEIIAYAIEHAETRVKAHLEYLKEEEERNKDQPTLEEWEQQQVELRKSKAMESAHQQALNGNALHDRMAEYERLKAAGELDKWEGWRPDAEAS